MKRHAFAMLAVLALTAPTLASAVEEGEHQEHPQDTPGFILHHVMDSDEYEFEIPWPGAQDSNPTLHLGEIFKGLRFEGTPGACEKPAPAAYSAFPGVGTWLNGCYDFRPTKSIFMMWIATALLLLFVAIARRPSDKLVARGLAQNGLEAIVLFVRDELAVKNIGRKDADLYVPFLVSVFFFILAMNLLGLVPNMATATGNLAITCALALCTFVLTQLAGLRSAGVGGYLGHLTGGVPAYLWPIMIPVEILGLFTKPFALMMRLFANMVAGHIVLFFLLGLIFMLTPAMALFSVPISVAIYMLEIFVALLQAYVFTMLSALFIGQGVAMGHHDEAHGEGHGH
jgi:F-type H+-transporting ATPase subunit a